MERIRKHVLKIVASHFEVEEAKISSETHFELDLGADSVDLILFVIQVENQFGVVIPVERLPELYTPEKAVEYLKKIL